MNNLKKIYTEHKDIVSFSKAYCIYIGELLKTLNHKDIAVFAESLEEARLTNKTIFIAGNGGSASTASHMATDLGAVMYKINKSDSPFRIQPLTDNVANITAIGNDFGYEHIFTKQLETQYREGDTLIVVSASGNSPNIIEAADFVRARRGKVLGLLGFDGGKLKERCDISVLVNTPQKEYGPVEDVHLILNHMLMSWLHLTLARK